MKGLPVVSSCEESGCYYNHDATCHAPAINVGDQHPRCDTFVQSASHTGRQPIGLVGACHVAACRHNVDLTCGAPAIAVGRHGDHADCITFHARA